MPQGLGRCVSNFIASRWRAFTSRRHVKRLRDALRHNPDVYVSVGQPIPENENYAGLLSYHEIKRDGERHGIYYWTNKAALQSAPSQSTSPTSEGWFSDYRPRQNLFFVRPGFWKGFIALSVFVGAFVSLWDRGMQIVEAPDIEIVMDSQSPERLLNQRGRSPDPIGFLLTNHSRFASVSVGVKCAFLRSDLPDDAGSGNLEVETIRIPRIGPGVTKKFSIRPKLPPVRGAAERPQAYRFLLKTDAVTGIGRNAAFEFKLPPVTIWRVMAIMPPASIREQGGRCVAQGRLYSGKAQTGVIDVDIQHPTRKVQSLIFNVHIDRRKTVSSPPRPPFSSPSGRSAKQRLEVPDLDAFREYPYTVQFRISGLQRGDCSKATIRTEDRS